MWRIPAVRDYVLFGVLLILGAGMATPFHAVQFINHLRGSPETATTAIAVAGALVMLGQGFFGRLVDRHGLRAVGAASLVAIAAVPLLWLVAREPAHGVALWLLNGLVWAAGGAAIFNLMLAVSDDSNRASVVAWVNTLQAPANFGAPLVGGFLAEHIGLPALFLLASAVLAASWAYFIRSFGARPSMGVL